MIRPILYLIISCFCALAYAGEKRALIVAVGSYPENSGWNKLSSANDAQLMRIILQRQGFNDKDITILTDEKATKANIIKTMVKLIAQSNKNDVVVFHFSGHGQQITDINGDELDGLDEALIPYDALKQASDKYKGENHLIDDELNEFLKRLRKKVGPGGDVIFILDACHSGTATRGQTENGVIRGTELKFELEGTLTKKSVDNNHKFDEQLKPSVGSVSNISPYVVISASGQQELNMEIKDQNNIGYGSLTFALSKLLATNSKSLSYEALFDQLRNEMCTLFAGKHQQTPQLEGETSRLLFAGKAVEIPSHCRVISVVNSAKVIIDIGELSGLTTGSEISFYPISTVIPEKQSCWQREL
jgi:metacaspase-1